MRIARVLTRLNLGGPARQVLASDPLLGERGHEVRIFAGTPEPGEGDLFEHFRERGLDVVRVADLQRGPHPLRDLRGRRELARGLADFAPDVIHTHAAKAGALGRAAGWAATVAPLVHTFHGHVLEGYFPRILSRRMAAFESTWAERCTRVLAVSEATARDLARLGVLERERMQIVPPGVDLDALLELPALGASPSDEQARARESFGLLPDRFTVLLLGRLAPVKRPELALEAFARLNSARPDTQLLVVGDGEQRGELDRRLAEGPEWLRQRVRLAGALEDVTSAHLAADACLCSSRSEGLPVALLEAAAAGRPAVAVDVGGIPELIEDGRTGSLVDGGGGEIELAADLAFRLKELVVDPELCDRMGRAARERVRQRHTARVLADRLEQVYREAVAEGRRHAS